MNIYSIGDVIPQLKTGSTLVQMAFDGSLWELRIGFPAIAQEEINELQIGDVNMAIANIKETLFCLFSIGRIPWCDAPYEPRLLNTPLEYPTEYAEGTGAPLLILTVDSATGVLKGMRMVSIGHKLTQRLHSICAKLNEKRPLDVGSYDRRVDEIYAQYPSSLDLLHPVQPADMAQLTSG